MKRTIACFAVILGLSAVTQSGLAQSKLAGWGERVDLLLLGDALITRVDLRIEIDGKPADVAWERAMTALFDFLDRDRDGVLGPTEAERMPTPFDLRRLLWGNYHPPTSVGNAWKTVDTNADGKVSRTEFATFYQRAGIGMQVGAVRIPGTDALTSALVKQLDRDGDGKVSLAELKAAEESLAPLDLNEDELITPNELIRGTGYPGSIGAIRLDVATAHTKWPAPRDPGLWLLPPRMDNTDWTTALHGTLCKGGKLSAGASRLDAKVFAALDADRDGSLSVAELTRWGSLPPAGSWTIGFDKAGAKITASKVDKKILDGKLTRFSVRTDPGKITESWAKARQGFVNQFVAADTNRNGFIDESSSFTLRDRGLKVLLSFADRNGDGKLTRTEFDAWLALVDALVHCQILVTALDHGHGLFEMLDADADGALSVRELRTAGVRLEKAECIKGGSLDLNRLPGCLRLTVSRGHPKVALPAPLRTGPEWFLAMDRNGDGDVSRREWIGAPTLFDQYDLDRDGLLSPDEAERVDLKKQK